MNQRETGDHIHVSARRAKFTWAYHFAIRSQAHERVSRPALLAGRAPNNRKTILSMSATARARSPRC